MRDYKRYRSKNTQDWLKKYIWDFLKSEKMTLCYVIIFLIQTRFFIFIDQVGNKSFANLLVYQ